jgi:hypothetical protein
MRESTVATGGVIKDIASGMVAGAGAGWAMGKATTFMYEREDPAARAAEERASAGKISYQVAAEKIARLAGRELDAQTSRRLGEALHWALAIGAGGAYGALRGRIRWLGLGGGLLFGALFFVLFDEIVNVVLGFTPGPRSFPWQAHARGLVGHLVYGAVTDAELRLLDGVIRTDLRVGP